MRMKSIIIASAATFAMAGSAYALTLQEAYQQLGGMHCSGSTCTTEQTVTTPTQLPDVITSSERLVSPAVEGNAPTATAQPIVGCWTTFMGGNGKLIPATNVNADCTPNSLNSGKGGSSASYAIVTTSTPGGSVDVVTCSVTSKELVYHPNSDRANSWSITTSTSSESGAC